jgi:hypothetical protein
MAEGKTMMRYLLILVSILAACTFPPISNKNTAEMPDAAIPESPPVEIVAPKKEPAKPRKAAPKPAEKPDEPELTNPLADCLNLDIQDPKEAARAKLDCMKERLDIQP